ncbi:MAG: hypothetical protein KDC26_10470 [Armatimonadetes bacterium]|nr:hypothetical protein [Armatimonadota bacterium]
MPITALLVASVLLSPQQETREFKDKDMDLAFQYPREWKVKKISFGQAFEFTVDEQPCEVRLINMDMEYPADLWQKSVSDIAVNRNQIVERQWEEELLGVPLLLSRLFDETSGNPTTTLVGLLFANTKNKLNFRVEAPTPVFPRAEQMWRDVLATARPLSGQLPGQAGTKPPETGTNTTHTNTKEPKTVVIGGKENTTVEYKTAPTRLLVDETSKIYGYFPEGWTIEGAKASHRGVTGTIEVTAGTGAKETARKLWLSLAGRRLGEMDSVTIRKDKSNVINLAGYETFSVWRKGPSEGQEIAHFVASGWKDGLYWVFTWDGSGAELDAALPTLEELTKAFSVSST